MLGEGFSARDVGDRLVGCVKEQGDRYLRLGVEIVSMECVREDPRGEIEVKVGVGLRGGEVVVVDKVVVATQASSAVALLGMLEGSLRAADLGEMGEREAKRVRGMVEALKEVKYRVCRTPLPSHCVRRQLI